jgi:hypothetical protein
MIYSTLTIIEYITRYNDQSVMLISVNHLCIIRFCYWFYSFISLPFLLPSTITTSHATIFTINAQQRIITHITIISLDMISLREVDTNRIHSIVLLFHYWYVLFCCDCVHFNKGSPLIIYVQQNNATSTLTSNLTPTNQSTLFAHYFSNQPSMIS